MSTSLITLTPSIGVVGEKLVGGGRIPLTAQPTRRIPLSWLEVSNYSHPDKHILTCVRLEPTELARVRRKHAPQFHGRERLLQL